VRKRFSCAAPAVLALAAGSSAAMSGELLFTCSENTPGAPLLIHIGDVRDGYPLQSLKSGDEQAVDAVVQYAMTLRHSGEDTGFVSMKAEIVTVRKTPEGRLHENYVLDNDDGFRVRRVSFNVDAEDVRASAAERSYACELEEPPAGADD
jgi:hypothetical protein